MKPFLYQVPLPIDHPLPPDEEDDDDNDTLPDEDEAEEVDGALLH